MVERVTNAQAPSNWNLPNVLTSLRILFIPVFAWLVLSQRWWWAFGLFVALMITDKLDGDIARARGLVTDFGKIADPIADKALTGAALIREKEHGTVEHLLVMPVTPTEIMFSKIWSMGLVVLLGSIFSLSVVVQALMAVPVQGSVVLFLAGAVLMVFAMTGLGIFLATIAGSMPQFALLLMMALLPLQVLSGAMTPRESMPEIIQTIMLAAPNTHFIILSQGILFRGAGLDVVWPQFAALAAIGVALFWVALIRFKKFLR